MWRCEMSSDSNRLPNMGSVFVELMYSTACTVCVVHAHMHVCVCERERETERESELLIVNSCTLFLLFQHFLRKGCV